MLKTDMKEARTGILVITDMKETTVEKLLEFVYSGKVSGNPFAWEPSYSKDGLVLRRRSRADRVSVDDLLYAADKYLIDDLVCGKVEVCP